MEYLFYCETSAGSGYGSVSFNLLNLNSNQIFNISFSGYAEPYDEMDPISANLINNKKLLSYLEKKISLSKLVYRPSKDDLDLSNPKNYRKNWRIKNYNIYSILESQKNHYYDLIMPEYNTNIFDNISHGSEITKVENDNFIIKSYFKDAVIAYDKVAKKYFVVWVPEFHGSWIDNLEFKNEYEIQMTERDQYFYNVDHYCPVKSRIKTIGYGSSSFDLSYNFY